MTDPDDPVRLSSPTEERNPATTGIDALDSRGVVDLIVDEDRVVHAAVAAVAGSIARAVDCAVAAWWRGGTIHYAGAGTSGRLAVLDAVELLPTYSVGEDRVVAHLAGGDRAMFRSAEGAEDDADAGHRLGATLGPDDVMVGLAASGRTPYVGGALRGARERGAATVLIAANPRAPLAALADVPILPDTGPEVVTGSTRMKAATAQKLVLNTLSTALMIRCGKTYENLMIDLHASNAKLRGRAVRILLQATGRDRDECAAALAAAGDRLRVALVALLAGTDTPTATSALAGSPPDPRRSEDPSGIRTAVAAARSGAVYSGT